MQRFLQELCPEMPCCQSQECYLIIWPFAFIKTLLAFYEMPSNKVWKSLIALNFMCTKLRVNCDFLKKIMIFELDAIGFLIRD